MAVINMLPAAIIEQASEPILEVIIYTRGGSSQNNCSLFDFVNGNVKFSNQGSSTVTGTYLKKDGYNIKAVTAGKYLVANASRADNLNLTLTEQTFSANDTIHTTSDNNVYFVVKVGED